MAPKCKVQNPPKDTKLVKKRIFTKRDDASSIKKEDNISDKKCKGKDNTYDLDENKLCSSIKTETISPELLEENHNINKLAGMYNKELGLIFGAASAGKHFCFLCPQRLG